jgi:hypothetical protein
MLEKSGVSFLLRSGIWHCRWQLCLSSAVNVATAKPTPLNDPDLWFMPQFPKSLVVGSSFPVDGAALERHDMVGAILPRRKQHWNTRTMPPSTVSSTLC